MFEENINIKKKSIINTKRLKKTLMKKLGNKLYICKYNINISNVKKYLHFLNRRKKKYV